MTVESERSTTMRIKIGIAIGVAVTGVGLTAAPALAQNAAYCAVAGGRNGYENCGYYTLNQCREAVSGVGGFCIRNPRHVERPYADEPPPPNYRRRYP
jgi:hypothetical protein